MHAISGIFKTWNDCGYIFTPFLKMHLSCSNITMTTKEVSMSAILFHLLHNFKHQLEPFKRGMFGLFAKTLFIGPFVIDIANLLTCSAVQIDTSVKR